uniref:Uncharacterized protein n=1 Tax=Anguilla anguilla TaxID=7936 RepID=A0A0E9RTF2_ANGAN
MLEQPAWLPHTCMQCSGLMQISSSANRMREIIPGMTMMNIGRIFRQPAIRVEPLARAMSLAASTRWTMT